MLPDPDSEEVLRHVRQGRYIAAVKHILTAEPGLFKGVRAWLIVENKRSVVECRNTIPPSRDGGDIDDVLLALNEREHELAYLPEANSEIIRRANDRSVAFFQERLYLAAADAVLDCHESTGLTRLEVHRDVRLRRCPEYGADGASIDVLLRALSASLQTETERGAYRPNPKKPAGDVNRAYLAALPAA